MARNTIDPYDTNGFISKREPRSGVRMHWTGVGFRELPRSVHSNGELVPKYTDRMPWFQTAGRKAHVSTDCFFVPLRCLSDLGS